LLGGAFDWSDSRGDFGSYELIVRGVIDGTMKGKRDGKGLLPCDTTRRDTTRRDAMPADIWVLLQNVTSQ